MHIAKQRCALSVFQYHVFYALQNNNKQENRGGVNLSITKNLSVQGININKYLVYQVLETGSKARRFIYIYIYIYIYRV